MKSRVAGSFSRSTDATKVAAWLQGLNYGADSRLENPYEQSVAVFRCVQVIAGSLARVPLVLYRGEERIEGHPLADLLARPNGLMTQAKLIQTLVAHQLLEGAAFLYLDEPDSRGIPRALLPLPPRSISPIRPRGNLYDLRGWALAQGGGERAVLPVERVARFEYAPHPADPLRGVSPLVVARLVVETDHLATVWNRATLENSGTPAGVLRWKGEGRLDDKDARLVRQQWLDTYGGAGNADSIAVLGSNFEWQSIGSNAKDMQWLDARRFNLSDIARAFSVPLLFLNEFEASGLSDAGMRVQSKILYTSAIIPLATQMQQSITDVLIRPIEPDLAVYFDFDGIEALRDDTTEKLEHAAALKTMGYPLNAINRKLELGMDEVPWGDEALVPSGQTTASTLVALSSLDTGIGVDEGVMPADEVVTDAPVLAAESATPDMSGAMLDALVVLIEKVAAGLVPYAAAKGILTVLYGLTSAQADAVLGGAADRTATALPDVERSVTVPLGVALEPSQAVEAILLDRKTFASVADVSAWADARGLTGPITEDEAGYSLRLLDEDMIRPRTRRRRRAGLGAVAVVAHTVAAYTGPDGEWTLPPHRLALWRARTKTNDQLEVKALKRIRRLLIEARSGVLRALEASVTARAAPGGPPDPGAIDKVLAEVDAGIFSDGLRAILGSALKLSLNTSVADLISIGIADDSAYEAMAAREPQIAERYYAERQTSQVEAGERVRDALRTTLVEGYRNGENLSDMKDRVRELFNVTAQRARTVARTEVNIAASEGQWAVYEKHAVEQIEWMSALDDEVRSPEKGDEYDHRLDGDIVDRGEAFKNDLRYPRAPEGEPGNVINCRCAFVAVTGEW